MIRLFVTALTLTTMSLLGVIRRHDVEDLSYRSFGSAEQFFSVGKVSANSGSGTGTLIDPHTVLTAAHVVIDSETATFTLHHSDGAVWKIADGQVYIHEDFYRDHDEQEDILNEIRNDIALIRLESRICDVTSPSLKSAEILEGFPCRGAGYGATGTGLEGGKPSDWHKRGFTNSIDGIYHWDRSGDFIVLTFKPPDDPDVSPFEGIGGKGDSGAPIFIMKTDDNGSFEPTIVGIVTILINEGKYEDVNLVLPIKPFHDWIEKNRFTKRSHASELGGWWNDPEVWKDNSVPFNNDTTFFEAVLDQPVTITVNSPLFIDAIYIDHEMAKLTLCNSISIAEFKIQNGTLSLKSPSIDTSTIRASGPVSLGGTLQVELKGDQYADIPWVTLLRADQIVGQFEHVEIESDRDCNLVYTEKFVKVSFN